ncbi:MAG: Ribosomal RNA small subunit methyltransferase A [Alphaproteobacteria bacterium MarineAlpha10_Bin3]|nr:MAG: Ribosomal RNA small subunit methyltransferase A [Alphaproteobacteria bacterium MarineAlpha10_Bin3]PPR70849.1 MAG: Ribosomal RNA small subunit methyltransferase A [Alphaproteobacteria bacterium MarineAlpha4_Bin1]
MSERRDPIDSLPPLRTVIAHHGLDARKSLGQHFLLDLNLTFRIARAAGNLGKGTVIEVGPGPGGLTRALLGAGAARVIAIERDPRCIEALAELRDAAGGRLEIIAADAREIDIATLGDAPRRIVANLPYNVATPLLIDWLTKAEAFAGMTLMFQREVADRITAHAGEPAYGRLSVIANWRCRTAKLLNLPARAFTPAPKVASAVIALIPYANPPFPADQAALEAVTAAAFGQRRKMLRGALKSLKTDPLALLKAADIDPTARAETVDIAGFAALARAYAMANPDAIP